MCQGMGQEGAAGALGGERAGTACQGFLHCPGDGAVGMCPVLALRLAFLLPFLFKAMGPWYLMFTLLVFFRSQWYWLKPDLRIFPNENWNSPNVRIGISSFWQYCSLVSTNFKENTRRCWAAGALGSFLLQFLYSSYLELFGIFKYFLMLLKRQVKPYRATKIEGFYCCLRSLAFVFSILVSENQGF